MAFAKNIGKKKKFFNLHGGVNIFVPRLIPQIINDIPPPKKTNKKTRKKNPLSAISDAQF
jgi:hypothetical protein